MADTAHLHHALLRPAILHILRAAGFHSTRPSVLDTLTDLCARYLLLLAQRTAHLAAEREALSHSDPLATTPLLDPSGQPPTPPPAQGKDAGELGTEPPPTPTPTLPDLLTALTLSNAFHSSLPPTSEAWRETTRRPLSSYHPGVTRDKERRRRDTEDTKDVREFVDWCVGPIAREERRIAGVEVREVEGGVVGIRPVSRGGGGGAVGAVGAVGPIAAGGGVNVNGEEREQPGREKVHPDDYVTAMKKKYSRTGDGARYAGTVLGKHAAGEETGGGRGMVRIEGGVESLGGWREEVLRRRKGEVIEGTAETKGLGGSGKDQGVMEGIEVG